MHKRHRIVAALRSLRKNLEGGRVGTAHRPNSFAYARFGGGRCPLYQTKPECPLFIP